METSACPAELLVVIELVHDGPEMLDVEGPGKDPKVRRVRQRASCGRFIGGQDDREGASLPVALQPTSPILRTTTSDERVEDHDVGLESAQEQKSRGRGARHVSLIALGLEAFTGPP
jgi:hypothetical protein